jgi:DNA replication protein DnaC
LTGHRLQAQNPTLPVRWATAGRADFDARLGLLVEAEALARDNKRLQKLLRDAKLRLPTACLEDIDHAAKRELDKTMARQLGTGRWIAEKQNVIITGACGVGKTYFACALGQFACRIGQRVLYRRVPRLFEELALSHADGTYTRLLARFAKTDVLILDDWGLAPLNDQQCRDILEILEDRHALHSTVVTSQLSVENWHDFIAHPTIADAVMSQNADEQFRRDSRRLREPVATAKQRATGIAEHLDGVR